VPEIPFFHQKIRKVPGIFLNLSLNLNLAILKMRIAGTKTVSVISEEKGEGKFYFSGQISSSRQAMELSRDRQILLNSREK
jgi:hypothetical protein